LAGGDLLFFVFFHGVFVFVLVAESFVASWCSFAITGGEIRVSSVENAPSAF
jgi:hypothetical protein